MSVKQCPTVSQQFFENPMSEAWLYIIKCKAALLLMNDLWTEEKSELQPKTVKAMLMVKVNLGLSCTDFHQQIRD